MLWQRYPLLRVFILFCTGIVLENYLSIPYLLSQLACGLLLLFSLISYFKLRQSRGLHFKQWFGLSLSLYFLSLGVLVTQWHSQQEFSLHLSPDKLTPEGNYRIRLLEPPQAKTKSLAAMVQISRLDSSGHLLGKARGMLYLQPSRSSEQLGYGDIIYTRRTAQEISPPHNPWQFNYRRFLSHRAIYYQLYLDSSAYRFRGEQESQALIAWAHHLRGELIKVIDHWALPAREAAVSKALLLGYRYDIDDDQLRSYAAAGAMHVLAVSGLHVGILYLLAYHLLFFMRRMPRGELMRSLLLVLLLWGFALLTGLSASVVRASCMFSFVALGSAFHRHTSVYNTILASAFLLLLIRPGYLFEVGFQLSYAAVFGIVWLQPRFEAWWQPRPWILRQLWAITTVSLAAQLATFPLSLYYFHQFPSLFLLANLLVIPLVSVLMYLGIFCLLLSSFQLMPDFLLMVYQRLIQMMNRAVALVEEQSAFLIEGIHINTAELILLYCILLSFFTWAISGGWRRIAISLSAVLLLTISQLWEKWQLAHHYQVVAYHLPRHFALGIQGPERNFLISDTSLSSDPRLIDLHMREHWYALGFREAQFLAPGDSCKNELFWYRDGLLLIGGRYLMLWPSPMLPPENVRAIWLITESCSPPEGGAIPEELVLSTALNYQARRWWTSWAEAKNVPLHDVTIEGAWQYDPLSSGSRREQGFLSALSRF